MSATRERLQRLGGFMAAMVIPNIAAIIAWGLITALFIPTGWLPNEGFAKLVDPMIRFLLPVLIGYTGGKLVYDTRGGVVGAVATMGIVVGAAQPMFLGGMIAGPLGGWVMKKFDQAIEDKVPVGFEMLVNNFGAGIVALVLALLGQLAVGPVVEVVSDAFRSGVDGLMANGLLPLADLIIEPAKVLFLNNALNHGVLGPAGVAEAAESGKAIHFLLETNPGPGLGLLFAFAIAGQGSLRQSAPGAMVVHFLGGIHEIYFPYVLAHPIMIVALWAGGIAADFCFVLLDAGLVATPSPGSIFAYLAVIPKGSHIAVLAGVAVGAIASFVVGTVILRVFPVHSEADPAATAPA